jgi:two-component system nitrate/nitrite response regulator NarL
MAEAEVTTAGRPIRVLLADDDETYLSSLRALIERQPELQVIGAARNGLEAIELARVLTPEACVLDLHMPLLDGVAAAAQLRRDHPSICLIALTADDDVELHTSVLKAGADAVLLKGEMVDALLQRLSDLRALATL